MPQATHSRSESCNESFKDKSLNTFQTSQFVQDGLPVTEEYFPKEHMTQEAPAVEKYPKGQLTQAFDA